MGEAWYLAPILRFPCFAALFAILLIVSCAEREAAAPTAAPPAAARQPVEAPKPAETRKPAETVVAALYAEHGRNASPFFQTDSRERVDTYFEKSLADLIWKDAVAAAGEVGALEFDPLYNAQDTDIKNFAVQPAQVAGDRATVIVTFDNYGEKQQLTWSLVPAGDTWKIADVDYGDGHTLRTVYTANAAAPAGTTGSN